MIAGGKDGYVGRDGQAVGDDPRAARTSGRPAPPVDGRTAAARPAGQRRRLGRECWRRSASRGERRSRSTARDGTARAGHPTSPATPGGAGRARRSRHRAAPPSSATASAAPSAHGSRSITRTASRRSCWWRRRPTWRRCTRSTGGWPRRCVGYLASAAALSGAGAALTAAPLRRRIASGLAIDDRYLSARGAAAADAVRVARVRLRAARADPRPARPRRTRLARDRGADHDRRRKRRPRHPAASIAPARAVQIPGARCGARARRPSAAICRTRSGLADIDRVRGARMRPPGRLAQPQVELTFRLLHSRPLGGRRVDRRHLPCVRRRLEEDDRAGIDLAELGGPEQLPDVGSEIPGEQALIADRRARLAAREDPLRPPEPGDQAGQVIDELGPRPLGLEVRTLDVDLGPGRRQQRRRDRDDDQQRGTRSRPPAGIRARLRSGGRSTRIRPTPTPASTHMTPPASNR